MGLIASAAARSGIIAIAVFFFFVCAGVVLLEAPMEWRLRAFQRSFINPPFLTTLMLGWIGLFAWLWLAQRRPSQAQPGRLARAGWAIVTTLLVSVGIVALYQGVCWLFGDRILWYWGGVPWRYWLRLLEGTLFAVAIVRIALPLLPRFDRVQPRNV